MKKETAAPTAKVAPNYVYLLDRAKDWPAGTILPATADTLALLTDADAKHRPATARECSIAGFSS
ncbi:MAG TPA: hypothetical protein PL193_07610 [Xanthobacteraceae bacterium]|nr:hypothetical protein [Xanthobacteraceae bacterium]